MKIEHITYGDWQNCIQVSNTNLKLIATTDVGPRIISLGFQDGENLFYQHPEQMGTTGGDSWKMYGGHRLWVAPEDLETTYAADNQPVTIETSTNRIRLSAPVDSIGVQKGIECALDGEATRVRVQHFITNRGSKPLMLSPWALTVMKPGGVAVIPHNLEPKDQLVPTHSMALWGYTRMSDPRWTWGDQFILLKQDPFAPSPQKIGCMNQAGWAAYVINNQMFVKHFGWQKGEKYPDFNCNFEAYTNDKVLELESLGPLIQLDLGDSVSHQEDWDLYQDVPTPHTEADITEWILPKLRLAK